ncbi:MAG: hypothetical protein EOP85_18750 [Verrucomicrobiaceae bacterium]|nr:MAG: hypothetical protein EOP85_18750 [Verrucomicrobiaceae bacterium]
MHPSGNLLVAAGFAKRPSPGLQGTSCYSLAWREGRIELHGSCAGWFRAEDGFVFIRPMHRCVGWDSPEPPVPGDWDPGNIITLDPETVRERMIPFLDWWIAYEDDISYRLGSGYRERCHREFHKAPRSEPWLKPDDAMRWIRTFRHDPASLVRAKRFLA